jgi:hypothetical protein
MPKQSQKTAAKYYEFEVGQYVKIKYDKANRDWCIIRFMRTFGGIIADLNRQDPQTGQTIGQTCLIQDLLPADARI